MTAKEFFTLIELPKNWRLIGENNVMDGDVALSKGLLFDIGKPGVIMRIFYLPHREDGGVVKKTDGCYNMILDSATPGKISEYINQFYS